jgi:recombinational DNA repair protein (RecF pathway)
MKTKENPPEFEPTRCAKCNQVISLSEDGYSIKGGEYICLRCSDIELSQLFPVAGRRRRLKR